MEGVVDGIVVLALLLAPLLLGYPIMFPLISRYNSSKVPFFYFPLTAEEPPPFQELKRCVDIYHSDVSKLLYELERSALLSEESERIFVSGKNHSSMAREIREKRAKLAEILEYDGFVLESMLRPFPIVNALTSSTTDGRETATVCNVVETEETFSTSKRWVLKSRARSGRDEKNRKMLSSTYSSAVSVITHLARDWTETGDLIRQSHYGWFLRELISFHANNNIHGQRVLVPGAGLGRLAHEIANVGYTVEANDCSIVMAAVAYQMLNSNNNRHDDNVIGFHPFATDPFVNEVNSSLRYKKVRIEMNDPPLVLVTAEQKPSSSLYFSYAVGDFVSMYSSPSQQGVFDSVVTCFFLDTATNIYEYISTIRNVLKPGGVWLNLGPVQWHENALIRPTSDELRTLIQNVFEFHVRFWQVDVEPMNYRTHEEKEEESRSTRYDGYRPLRFIAVKSKESSPENTWHCIESLRSTFDRMSHVAETKEGEEEL